jgi:hypothetical protein
LFRAKLIWLFIRQHLVVETMAAHLSLRQQKITLANRPSLGQPITTNNNKTLSRLITSRHTARLILLRITMSVVAKGASLGCF